MRAFVLALLVLGSAARAETLDPALKAYLAKFADMAGRGAADAMAKVTRFPLKNQVYQEPAAVSAAGFKHHFQVNGYRNLAGCLKSTPPKRASGPGAELGEWEVDCEGSVFHFAQEGAAWLHSGFENVNE